MPVTGSKKYNIDQKRLSIQIDLSGFSFIIKDSGSTDEKIIYRVKENFPAEIHNIHDAEPIIKKIVKKESLLNKKYSSVSVYFDTEKYTLIPTSLYVPGEELSLLNKLFETDDLDEVHALELPEFDATMIYIIPNSITAPLYNLHEDIKFYPISLPLLLNNSRSIGSSNNRISVYYKRDIIHIVATSGRQLKLAGAYPAEEFFSGAYFIFNTGKEVMFNPEHTSIYLYEHDLSKDVNLLSRYYKTVKLCALSEVI